MTKPFTSIAKAQVNRRTLLKSGAAASAMGLGLGLPTLTRAQEPLTIAFSVPGLNFPFFVHMLNLAEQHAASLGGIEFIGLDGQEQGAPSSTKQTADLEAMIAQGIDGLVISPNDAAALAPAIESVIEAGIPVVTVDRNVEEGVATLAHVGADNVEGGRIQARYLIELFPDGAEVFELQGQPGASAAILRHQGLEEVLSEQEAVKVIVSQPAAFARADAVRVMEASLASNPEPDAVVCANDDMAFGAAEVAQANGLNIPIIGFDALPEALIAIQEGRMAATIEQFPGGQASGAIDILVSFLRDGTEPAEHDTYLVPALITADNLGEAERAAEAGLVADEGTAEATPAG
ncbi:MAG: substrate-binding domain-containing protein [Thermomicrobiales bacterium]